MGSQPARPPAVVALLQWLGRNIEGVLGLTISLVIVFLDIFSDVGAETLSGAILFVLGVMALSMLRDRDYVRRAAALEPQVERLREQLATMEKSMDDAAMVHTLSWAEIHQELAEGRRDTDRWLFRGGTGTYIRAVTLADCVANARRNRRALMVRLEIIDPTNDEVCSTYARFRQSLSSDHIDWTTDRTRRESYATIVAAAWHRQRYELLDVEVALSPVMPTLRWDLSERSLIITHEGPRGVALKVDNGKLLYDYTQTEMRKSFEQARRVPLDQARHVALGDEPSPEEVRRLFAALEMPLSSSLLEKDVADIIQRALHAENPYDR